MSAPLQQHARGRHVATDRHEVEWSVLVLTARVNASLDVGAGGEEEGEADGVAAARAVEDGRIVFVMLRARDAVG